MYRKHRGLIVLSLLGFVVFTLFAQSQAAQPQNNELATYIAEAERTQQEAQAVLTALNQALTAARNAGDTTAVQELSAAVRQAEVRVAQVVQQVALVRQAPTPAAAAAGVRNAQRALAQETQIVQSLPPRIAQTYYVAPVLTTVATTAATTTETTTETTVTPTTTATTMETTTVAATTTATTVATTTTVPPTTIRTTTTTSTTTTYKPPSP